MKYIVMPLTLCCLLSISAFAQVDSLWLEEIKIITSPEGVLELYTEDLNSDNIKELVLCGQTHFYIYSQENDSLIWTSPYSQEHHGRMIKFHDLNGDGYDDVTFKDTLGFHAFDVIRNDLLFESPPMQNFVYTLGDRNSDGYQDIILIYKENSIRDTAWINVYDGPDFLLSERHFFVVGGLAETPAKALLVDITGEEGLARKLMIFTNVYYSSYYYIDPYPPCWESSMAGNVKIIDPVNFTIRSASAGGSYQYYEILDDSISTTMYAMTNSFDYSGCYWNMHYYEWIELLALSADSSFGLQELWSGRSYPFPTWSGFITGDFSSANPGEEIVYGSFEVVYSKSFPGLIPLWSHPTAINQNHSIAGFIDTSLYANPAFIISIPQEVYDCTSGDSLGVFFNQRPDIKLIDDIDNDMRDEFFTFGENSLHIYHATRERPVSINDDNSSIPSSFSLSQNYPNPFNASTSISYNLPRSGMVNLAIYNLLGQKVATISDGLQDAGEHKVIWDAKDFPSGVYFARLNADGQSKSIKIVLMK